MDRVILHCDCNSFFASVEMAICPDLRDVPLAICGSEEQRHGIVLAKNELAKKCGVVTAETVYQAKKKCPGLVIRPPRYGEYTKYSRIINSIYSEYTELVEPFGIDESWLDVTASRRLFGSGEEIAELIRQRVKAETGLTLSIGVSFNKVFAKLGSDYKKPDAITVISRENYKDIVYPLPARDLLFVGKRTDTELKAMGVRTIGELAAVPRDILIRRFGKMGEMLYIYSNGLDSSPVDPSSHDEAKSISNGFTFKRDIFLGEEARHGIYFLCEEVGYKLRANSQKCSTVSLSIKDEYLRVIVRQRKLSRPTDISSLIAETAYSILTEEWQPDKPIRMLTVHVSGLLDNSSCAEQLDFFSESDGKVPDKLKKKEETVDVIRQKYGNASILRGSVIGSDIGIYDEKKGKNIL